MVSELLFIFVYIDVFLLYVKMLSYIGSFMIDFSYDPDIKLTGSSRKDGMFKRKVVFQPSVFRSYP